MTRLFWNLEEIERFGPAGELFDTVLTGPAPLGGISGPFHLLKSLLVPPQTRNVPPCEDCATKKVTGPVPLQCSSVSETPKILIVNPVFMSKNRFFANFAMKIFFFALHPRIRRLSAYFAMMTFLFSFSLSNSKKISFCAPQKVIYSPPPPPSHDTLAWVLTFGKRFFFFSD